MIVEKSPINIYWLRFIEFLLCTVCLSIAIYLLVQYDLFYVTCYILIVVGTTFTFLTLIDLFALWIDTPIPSNAWAMICTAGGLFFSLCLGLMIMCCIASSNLFLIALAILSGLAALVFVLELLWLMNVAWVTGGRESPVKAFVKPTSRPAKVVQTKQPPSRPYTPPEPVEETTIVPQRVGEPTQSVYRSYPPTSELAVQYPPEGHRPRRGPAPAAAAASERKPKVTSYGGTFHMSKDTVPMPGPLCTCGEDSECPVTRTVSVSTRLVLKGPRTQFRSQPSSPRGSPPDNRRAIKSAQQSGGSLDYDVSGAGTQYPAITYGPQPSRVKDKNLGTPQVPTDEAYTSTSSFVQQKSEKVQVSASQKPTKDAESATYYSESTVDGGSRDFGATCSCRPFTSSVATTANPGMSYYRCGRCGGTTQNYPYAQPNSGYRTCPTTCPPTCPVRRLQQLDSTPTRDCCPCPPSVQQAYARVQRYSPPQEPESNCSCSESSDDIVYQNEVNLPGVSHGTTTKSGSERSGHSTIKYNTTMTIDEESCSRKKRRKYKWMPTRRGRKECSIQ